MNHLKILLLDDDERTAKILEGENREVISCRSAQEALEAFGANAFDIFLSDINMPGMNGLNMIQEIRQQNQHIKIAIFTNFDNKQYFLDAIENGVDLFFSKPFHKEHFHNVITNLANEIIDKRKIEAELNRQQNILHVIKEMAEKFLQQEDWNKTLFQQMKALKDAAGASSIFVFKNQNTGNPVIAERYLSINDDYEAFTPNLLHYSDLDLQEWKKKLSNGEYVNNTIESFNARQRSLLRSYKINALLILPIFSNRKWWGFLGIGHTQKTLFDHSSLEMLETVARIIGSAIKNQQNLRDYKIRSAMFDHTVDGIIITDVNNRIVSVNNAFSDITGYSKADVLGKDPKFLKSSIYDKSFYQEMWQKINHEGYWQGEIKNRRKDDEIYIEWLSISSIKDSNDHVQNYIGIFSDVTAHRSSEMEFAYFATHDALTGLANRVLLEDRLNQAINHAKRFNRCVAVIFCDLDNFKPINDTYGHTVGDLALKKCSDYFLSAVRAEDTVCRYGGDEFVIIFGDIEGTQDLAVLTEKILNINNITFEIDGNAINLEMSAGISFYPQDTDNAAELIQKADEAMYRAKREGKNRLDYYGEKFGCQSTLIRPFLTAILPSSS
jgi:diguanylate cyclase (GGDEF)-like protein/PAS domain S-box-containing protein